MHDGVCNVLGGIGNAEGGSDNAYDDVDRGNCSGVVHGNINNAYVDVVRDKNSRDVHGNIDNVYDGVDNVEGDIRIRQVEVITHSMTSIESTIATKGTGISTTWKRCG